VSATGGRRSRGFRQTLTLEQAKLERKIGQQTLEIDFLKGCLQRIEEQRQLQALTGKPRSTGTSKNKSGGKRA
jgi:hypothetical protein